MGIELFGPAGEDFGDVFRLYFIPPTKPGETDEAKAWVVLGRALYYPDLHGNISLSAECLSYSEVDCHVDWLIHGLETVRKKAKEKYELVEKKRRRERERNREALKRKEAKGD